MRLFAAIQLSPAVREALLTAQADLRRQGRGAFPPPENLHLTLAFLGETDRPIGYVHVDDGEAHDLGYALAREAWGHGYAAEAAAAAVNCLRSGGVPFITATHDADNPRSGAVMARIGMTYRYSYRELWQPKNRWVTFRMYQMELNGPWPDYPGYWNRWPCHWV